MLTGEFKARNDIVMGMASGMPSADLKPFVKSLRDSGYNGDVLFFVQGLSVEQYDLLWSYNVRTIPIQRTIVHRYYGDLLKLLKYFALSRKDEFAKASAVLYQRLWSSRFFYYLHYLEECGCMYEHVILADTRDVVFQADPLRYQYKGLNVFLERSDVHFRDSIENSQWLHRTYGKKILRKIGDKVVSCSGVTIGQTKDILSYLRAMVSELMSRRYINYGSDQSAHNKIIYINGPRNMNIWANGDGGVLTMGSMDDAAIKTDGEVLLGLDGTPVSIVHQYDRHPRIHERIKQRYA